MKKVVDLLFGKVSLAHLLQGCKVMFCDVTTLTGASFSLQIFADPQLSPFFEDIPDHVLKHKQETMMEILFGGTGSVSIQLTL